MKILVLSHEPYWFQGCLKLNSENPVQWNLHQQISPGFKADLCIVQLDLSQELDLGLDPWLQILQKQGTPTLVCSVHSPSFNQCHWLIAHEIPFLHLPLQISQLWEKILLCSKSKPKT